MKPSEFAQKKLLEFFSDWEKKGGSQSSLATASGLRQGQISIWLRGGFLPNIDNLSSLAKGFSVSMSSFLPPDASDPSLGRLLELRAQLDDIGKDALLLAAEDLLREQRRRKSTPQNGSSAKGTR